MIHGFILLRIRLKLQFNNQKCLKLRFRALNEEKSAEYKTTLRKFSNKINQMEIKCLLNSRRLNCIKMKITWSFHLLKIINQREDNNSWKFNSAIFLYFFEIIYFVTNIFERMRVLINIFNLEFVIVFEVVLIFY